MSVSIKLPDAISAVFSVEKLSTLNYDDFRSALENKSIDRFMPPWCLWNGDIPSFELADALTGDALEYVTTLYNDLGAPASAVRRFFLPLVAFPACFWGDDEFCDAIISGVETPELIKLCDEVIRRSKTVKTSYFSSPAMVSSSDSPSAAPVDDKFGGDEAFIDFSMDQATHINVLFNFLNDVGYATFAGILHNNNWKTFKEVFPYDAKAGSALSSLMKLNHICSADVVSFFVNNCSAMQMELGKNHFANLQKDITAVRVSSTLLITPTAKYDFSTPFSYCMRLTETALPFAKLAKDAGLSARVCGLYMSPQMQIALTMMYFAAATRKEAPLSVKLPEIRADETINLRDVSIVAEDLNFSFPLKYKSSSSASQIAFLIRSLASDQIKLPKLHFLGKEVSAAQLYMNLNAVNMQEHYAFQLALTRARESRTGTVLNDQYKSCFTLIELRKGEYVPYDPTYVRMFHILADVCRIHAKSNLVIHLGSKADIVLADYILEFCSSANQNVKFVSLGNCPNAYDKYVATDADRDYVLVWLQNPANSNDYYIPKMPEMPTSDFTFWESRATHVYKVVSFASKVTHSVERGSLRMIKSDVLLPCNKLLIKTTKGYDYVEFNPTLVVPIGHNPHTVQRIVYWQVGALRVAVGAGCIKGNDITNYSDLEYVSNCKNIELKALSKYQIVETMIMSQNRYTLFPVYSSAEIIALKLSPQREKKAEVRVNATSWDEW